MGSDDGFMGFQIGTADEVDAIGDSREDGKQTIGNGWRISGKVHNERIPTHTGNLPGENV